MSAAVPRVAVFSTGGTIASKRSADGAASPNLTADDLVAAVPQLADVASIDAVSFRQDASSELTVSDVIALAGRIGRAVGDGAIGTVITQGTNTIEETSFVLDLLWNRAEPIVVTGAMRHPGLPGADGPANLLASALVAVSPLARDLGCLVVFNDEVHLPLFVRKTHTSSPATFRSPLTGPIGWIAENRLRIALRPVMRHHIAISDVPAVVPPVGLVKATLGDDGRVLKPSAPARRPRGSGAEGSQLAGISGTDRRSHRRRACAAGNGRTARCARPTDAYRFGVANRRWGGAAQHLWIPRLRNRSIEARPDPWRHLGRTQGEATADAVVDRRCRKGDHS